MKSKHNLTDWEIGLLEAVHVLLSRIIETSQNEKLKERLNKCFDDLPASEPDGLNWPTRK